MKESPIPSMSEANDVGNSIFDGADSLMLSSELGSGEQPANTLKFCMKVLILIIIYVYC